MPRITASVLAVSALLAGTALAATPQPQSSDVTLMQSVDSGLKVAQAKRSSGDYTGAIHVLSQLMLIAADDPRVVSEYGKVLVQQGRTREALDFLNRAAQLTHDDWAVYSALGVAYDQAGQYDSARGAYEHALALNPGSTAVLNNYAMSRALAGDLVTARKLIADASATSQDERIMRNFKMINSLTPKTGAPAAVAAVPPPVHHAPTAVRTAPLPPPAKTAATPRTLTSAEGRRVVMQAVPKDPEAGPVGRKARKATASAKPSEPPSVGGIPALRLANDGQ